MALRMIEAAVAVVAIMAGGVVWSQDLPTVPRFVEETATSGLNTVYAGDWEYMVGGGVATFDCNADGRADVLLAGGEAPATFYRNTSAIGGTLTFVAEKSGLEIDRVLGTYPLDIDGDTNTDLVLLRLGENLVMRGLGNCQFEAANEDWGFDGGDAWSTAFAATWDAGASWPTLAVGNYVDRLEEDFPWGSCTPNWLHRPDGEGGRFAPPLPLDPSFCALSILFTDWNRTGTASLRMSNDREYYKGGQEQLWHVKPGEAPTLYTPKEGWKALKIWGMGIASYDLDFDRLPEYFLTSMADNKLQRLKQVSIEGVLAPDYGDVAFKSGVTLHRPYTGGETKPSTAWHAQFEDVNNDALVDLFVAKGNVAKMPDFAALDPNNLMLQNKDGTFAEAGDVAGVASLKTSRGGAIADFNLDGLLDLVVSNRWEPAQIWRNTGPTGGGWLQLRIQQDGPNRDAIGGWIEVKTDTATLNREMTAGGGHASGQTGWWHFGLGSTEAPQIRVVWPDGTNGDWQSVEPNAFYIIERGKPAQVWTPEP